MSSAMFKAVLTLSLLAGPAFAQSLDQSPLAMLPRTKAEAARIAPVLAPTTDFTAPEPFEGNPAGAATVRLRPTADAFSQFSGNMPFDRQLNFNLGNALFSKTWVAAPSSTQASDGLGPLYNARACQDCHLKDGRGHVPHGDERSVSLFLRLSVPGGTSPQ